MVRRAKHTGGLRRRGAEECVVVCRRTCLMLFVCRA